MFAATASAARRRAAVRNCYTTQAGELPPRTATAAVSHPPVEPAVEAAGEAAGVTGGIGHAAASHEARCEALLAPVAPVATIEDMTIVVSSIKEKTVVEPVPVVPVVGRALIV